MERNAIFEGKLGSWLAPGGSKLRALPMPSPPKAYTIPISGLQRSFGCVFVGIEECFKEAPYKTWIHTKNTSCRSLCVHACNYLFLLAGAASTASYVTCTHRAEISPNPSLNLFQTWISGASGNQVYFRHQHRFPAATQHTKVL